jgi:hypothetical protein
LLTQRITIDAKNKELDTAIDALTLHDLFRSDFSSGDTTSISYGGFTLQNGVTHSLTHIEYAVVRQIETANEFMLLYVPYTKETAHVCESLADKDNVALGDFLQGRIDEQKTPGDPEQTSSKDLVFSKRILVYHEAYLSPEEIISVRDTYKKLGISVVLRSTDYLDHQKLEKS